MNTFVKRLAKAMVKRAESGDTRRIFPVFRVEGLVWATEDQLTETDRILIRQAREDLRLKNEALIEEAIDSAEEIEVFEVAMKADPSIKTYGAAVEWAEKNRPDLLKYNEERRRFHRKRLLEV